MLVDAGRYQGAGVILRGRGVLTAFHVVGNGGEFTLTETDGTRTTSAIVRAWPDKDLALLAFPRSASEGTTLDCSPLIPAEEVMIFGHPIKITWVGRLGRIARRGSPPGMDDFWLIYAMALPGDSGGPALSRDGRLRGIMSRIASHRGLPVSLPLIIPAATICEALA